MGGIVTADSHMTNDSVFLGTLTRRCLDKRHEQLSPVSGASPSATWKLFGFTDSEVTAPGNHSPALCTSAAFLSIDQSDIAPERQHVKYIMVYLSGQSHSPSVSEEISSVILCVL